jgi:SH3-like domain-containing protein
MKHQYRFGLVLFLTVLAGATLFPSFPVAATETGGMRIEPCNAEAYVADTDPKGTNVRSGPGQGYPVTATLPTHTMVSIIESAEEWMHIGTFKKNTWGSSEPIGWVYGPLLAVYGRNWRDEPSSGYTPIWEEGRGDTAIIAWAPKFIELRVIGCESNRVKVRYKDVEGWLVDGSYSADPPPDSPPSAPGKTMEIVPCDNVVAYVIDTDPKGANVRCGPGSGYFSIVRLPTDRPVQVTIVGAVGDWLRIKNPVFASKEDGEMTMDITAWVKASLLGVRAENAEDFAGAVSLYKDANAESGVVAEVPGDTGVTILAARGGWLKVKYEKQEGWLAPDAQCGDPFKECH